MKHKSSLVILILLLIIGVSVNAQNLLSGPESVAFDALNNRYLVSNYANGRVIAVDLEGNQTEYLTGLGHAYGNCIKDDIFYVSNGNYILGIDLATGDTTIYFDDYSPSVAIDGLTTDNAGYLYGVDTGGRII